MPSSNLILCCPFLFLTAIFPNIRGFPKSWLFESGGQSIGASASASVLPMNIQDLFPFMMDWVISLQLKELSRVFSTPQFESIKSSELSSSAGVLGQKKEVNDHCGWKGRFYSMHRELSSRQPMASTAVFKKSIYGSQETLAEYVWSSARSKPPQNWSPPSIHTTPLVAQLIKNLPAMKETPVQFLGREDLLEKGQATHSSILGLPWWLSW